MESLNQYPNNNSQTTNEEEIKKSEEEIRQTYRKQIEEKRKKEKTNDETSKKIKELKKIPSLSENELTQLRKMQQGMYFYNNGNFKLIKNIKTKDLNAILKTEKVVIKDKNGNIYYGDCFIKEDKKYINYVKNGDGTYYNVNGKMIFKGEYENDKKKIGLKKNTIDQYVLANAKETQNIRKYTDNVQLLYFNHTDELKNIRDKDEQFRFLSKKYTTSGLYFDLTKKNCQEGEYNYLINQELNEYVKGQNQQNLINLNELDVYISDHGLDNTKKADKANYKEIVNGIKTFLEKTKYPMNDNIENSENTQPQYATDVGIIRIKLDLCYGSLIDRKDNDLVVELTKLSKQYPQISFYIDRANDNDKVTTYNRTYKNGVETYGRATAHDKDYFLIYNDNGDVKLFLFGNKKDYQEDLMKQRGRYYISKLEDSTINQSDDYHLRNKKKKNIKKLDLPKQNEKINKKIEKIQIKDKKNKEKEKKELDNIKTDHNFPEHKEIETKWTNTQKVFFGLSCLCPVIAIFVYLMFEEIQYKKQFEKQLKKRENKNTKPVKNLKNTRKNERKR